MLYFNLKGHDKAIAEFCFDEVKKYLQSRFLCPFEAYLRSNSIKLHDEFPVVHRLLYHLENDQSIGYDEDEQLGEVIKTPDASKGQKGKSKRLESQFTAWLEANLKHPEHRNLLYKDYPMHFVYNKTKKVWTKRKATKPANVVTRLNDPPIKNKELFWLRAVLDYIPGATSYQDLHTVKNAQGGDVIYSSYYDVLRHLGVIEDNKHWTKVLDDALLTMHAKLCRHLFAYVLCYCELEKPNETWLVRKERFCDDLIKKHSETLDLEEIYQLGLGKVNEILIENGTSLHNYGFDRVPEQSEVEKVLNKSHINKNLNDHAEEMAKMTSEQREIFETIIQMSSDDYETEKLLFIDAPGGTGKSFVLNLAIKQCHLDGHYPIAVASSGIAAILLNTGKTAHYTFKIPLEVDEDSTCQFTEQSELANKIKATRLIIWDEAPMCNRYTIEAVEKSLRNLMKNNLLFGGKAVVFSGDFRQILPIVNFGRQEEAISLSIKRSYIWNKMKISHLTENLRIKGKDSESQAFANFLLEIGEDRVEKSETQTIEIPEELFSQQTDVEGFVREFLQDAEDDSFEREAILALKNEDANEINRIVLDEVFQDQDTIVIESIDKINSDKGNEFEIPIEIVHNLQPSGMPPHKLELKIGCIVMILRNMYPSLGFCNGTRCKVVDFQGEWLILEIISGDFKGNRTAIPKIPLKSNMSKHSLFSFSRYQYPVKLAYCITVNKSQGQSFDKVSIYFKDHPFSHGQLYVALSRCTNKKSIKIFKLIEDEEKNKIRNVVMKQIFD